MALKIDIQNDQVHKFCQLVNLLNVLYCHPYCNNEFINLCSKISVKKGLTKISLVKRLFNAKRYNSINKTNLFLYKYKIYNSLQYNQKKN